MLLLLIVIIGVIFLLALVLMLLLALCDRILARWAALTARSKMLLATAIVTLVGIFIALFPTTALGVFFIALILVAGSIMSYAQYSDARGRARREALMAVSRSIAPVPFAGPLTPRP